MDTLTVASYKGGVGKTTTAIHLAAYLSSRGRVLLSDDDPNGSARAWARRGGDTLGFRVVSHRLTLSLMAQYDYIVTDTAARPEAQEMGELAEGCRLLLLPTTPDFLSMDSLVLAIHALRSAGATNYRVVLTRVPPLPNHDGDLAASYLRELGVPLCETRIPQLVAFTKAAAQGVTVHQVEDDRAERAWVAYQCLCEEVLL